MPPPGPPSTVIFVMKRPSLDMLWLFSAFATADLSSFSIGSDGEHAGELQQHERFAHGLAADRIGDAAQLARAHAGELEVRDGRLRLGCDGGHFTAALSPRVTLEDARRRELAELVPDHVLGDEHRDVRLAVVDADRVTDHLRHDRRRAATRS